jgi:AmmeMemoRadiSam system protein B
VQIRKPVVAGQFYPDDRETCLAEIHKCLPAQVPHEGLPEPLRGGLVPHAGWTFSGALAALVFSAIKRGRGAVGTFVIFGAAHGYFGAKAAVDDSEAWDTPLGRTHVDESLRQTLLDSGAAVADSSAHRREHSIEVQLPFLQYMYGNDFKFVPICFLMHDLESAREIGRALAEVLANKNAVVIAEPTVISCSRQCAVRRSVSSFFSSSSTIL